MWCTGGRVFTTSASRGGRWRHPLPIASAGSREVEQQLSLGAAENGRAVALWAESSLSSGASRVRSAERTASGRWKPAYTLAISGFTDPARDLAMSRGGTAALALVGVRPSCQVTAALTAADGRFGPLECVAPDDSTGADSTETHVAVDGAGRALITWKVDEGDGTRALMATTL
jgi:hypothetical protein